MSALCVNFTDCFIRLEYDEQCILTAVRITTAADISGSMVVRRTDRWYEPI